MKKNIEKVKLEKTLDCYKYKGEYTLTILKPTTIQIYGYRSISVEPQVSNVVKIVMKK